MQHRYSWLEMANNQQVNEALLLFRLLCYCPEPERVNESLQDMQLLLRQAPDISMRMTLFHC